MKKGLGPQRPDPPGTDPRDDREVVGMARGGSLNLVSSVFSHVADLALSLIIARELGRSIVGVYWEAYAILALLSLIAVSGTGAALTRFVAVYRAENDPGGVRGTVRLGLAVTMGVSLLVGTCLWFAAGWLAVTAFDDELLVMPLRFTAITLPLVAFTHAALGATKGFKTMKPWAFIHFILEPLLRLTLAGVLFAQGLGLLGAMIALLGSHLAGAFASAVALRRLMGRTVAPARYRPRQLFSFSIVSWMASLASSGLTWADTILLGIYLSSGDVGVYNVATRVVVLASFVMIPITSSFAPRIAALHQQGRTETLRRTYAVATSWIVRLSLPGFIVIWLFPRDLLSIFGPGFATGAAVTVVLATGKFVDAGTGPCALMLNMSGRPAINMADNIMVLALNVAFNIWLIPIYGIIGSAVAWAIALALVNFARVIQVWQTLGMWPFGAGTAKGLCAGGGTLVAGLAVRLSAPPDLAFMLGIAAVVLVFVGLSLVFGPTADDRMLLNTLRQMPQTRGADSHT